MNEGKEEPVDSFAEYVIVDEQEEAEEIQALNKKDY
jgi:hypothetical protein